MSAVHVKLVVTGDLEEQALHESLRSAFPPVRKDAEVIWDPPRRLPGATSYRLSSGAPPSEMMLDLAQAMLAEALFGKRGTAADLVIVIDDVELGNVGREEVVAEHFRRAVAHKLARYDAPARAAHRDKLRERCSFHVLGPMVESYLFGDPRALLAAGVPAGQTPLLLSSDVEDFETNDPAWLPECRAANQSRRKVFPWWCHERHPKHYLEHLTSRGGGPIYDETAQGKQALLGLSWKSVPKAPVETALLRALFEDIAAWFDVPSPLGPGDTHPSFYPGKTTRPESLLLRNL